MVDPVLDDLKHFRFDPSRVGRRSRWWLFFGGLLIVLFFSLFLLEYPVGDVLVGSVESERLVDNQVVADDVTLIFSSAVAVWLQELFVRFQDREFSVCLSGSKSGNNYFLDAGYQPRVVESSVFHVTFDACDARTLVMGHSHPMDRCVASEQDIETLRDAQKNNPEMVMVVMCNREKFSVYR